jgi:hypothetical protein
MNGIENALQVADAHIENPAVTEAQPNGRNNNCKKYFIVW